MGVTTRIAQTAPAAAVSWTVYESVKRFLSYYDLDDYYQQTTP